MLTIYKKHLRRYEENYGHGRGEGSHATGGLSSGSGDGAADKCGWGGGDGLPGSERTNYWDIRGWGAPTLPIETDRGRT